MQKEVRLKGGIELKLFPGYVKTEDQTHRMVLLKIRLQLKIVKVEVLQLLHNLTIQTGRPNI